MLNRLWAVRPTLLRNGALGLVFAVVAAIALQAIDPFNPFLVYQLSSVMYFAIAAAGLTVLTGLNGQLSLGHGALMGIGAYTTVLLSIRGVSPVLTLPVGAALAALFSVAIGVPTFRLRGPYFTIATIGVGEAVRVVASGVSFV